MPRIRYHFERLADAEDEAVRVTLSERREARAALMEAFEAEDAYAFAGLALGIDHPAGNYSADEHGLGPKILASNTRAHERVLALAQRFRSEPGIDVPQAIREAGLDYCRVGVGSEISCMIRPQRHWVCNTRTLWTQVLFKHNSVEKANEELQLYRESDSGSEMYWPIWSELHQELGRFIKQLRQKAIEAGHFTVPKTPTLLWADAICNAIYATRDEQ